VINGVMLTAARASAVADECRWPAVGASEPDFFTATK